MLTLYLTRHGETMENASGILQGQSAGHLNDTGKRQAMELRDSLANEKFDSFISSDLRRALDTANIVNEVFRMKIFATPLLRERDWGEYTGIKVEDIHADPDFFPESVEGPVRLTRRAADFVTFLARHFDGQRVLAMGHGYFNRCVVAFLEQKKISEVPRWGNTEVRVLKVDKDNLPKITKTADAQASAD